MDNNNFELLKVVNSNVTSVFNKSTKEFGKQFMFDDNDETCWSSEQGNKNACIQVTFDKNMKVKYFEIVSQGGYCPKVLNYFKFMI